VLSILVCAALGAQRARRSGDPAEHAIVHGGRTRSYLVHDFSGDAKAPLVIVLHGGGGNADNAVAMTGFDRIAQRERFIAVYPNGTAGREGGRLLTWNAGHCCAAAMDGRVDDVGFIAAIVDRLVAQRQADPSRVYVTGMSNGGMMAHRLGRDIPAKLAAIAPVVGAVFGDEPPAPAPMPAFVVVGAEDHTVPGSGGPLGLRLLLGRASAADRNVAPAIDQASYWVKANGCREPKRRETRASTVVEWTDCSSGAPVVFHTVAGNGHAWPGGQPGRTGADRPSAAFDASDAMWTFFKAQRRR